MISILIPSRERTRLRHRLICSLYNTCDNINNIELIFGIDKDDPTLEQARKIVDYVPWVRIIEIDNNNQFIGLSRIWNILYKHAKYDILGYIGDDMIFKTNKWDNLIINEFTPPNLPDDQIKLVHCYDGWRNRDEISVNAFIHKKYTEIVGYFTREEFLINWSDQWMYETFKSVNRVVYRPDIYIHHDHWIYGQRERDNTANRMLSNNHDTYSNNMWHQLRPQHNHEKQLIKEYINQYGRNN